MNFFVELHRHPEFISNYIKDFQCWEPLTSELLREMMLKMEKDTHVFVDIGSNIGYFSLFVASHNVMHSVAFEPVHQNLQLLYQSIEDNTFHDRITVFPCALGDAEKTIRLNIDIHNFGCCSTRDDLIPYGTQWVQQRTLPNCLREAAGVTHGKRFMVKMDVELQEEGVLSTFSPAFLNQVDVLIVEISVNLERLLDMILPFFDQGILLETSKVGIEIRCMTWELPTTHLQTRLQPVDTLRAELMELKEHQVDIALFKQSFLDTLNK